MVLDTAMDKKSEGESRPHKPQLMNDSPQPRPHKPQPMNDSPQPRLLRDYPINDLSPLNHVHHHNMTSPITQQTSTSPTLFKARHTSVSPMPHKHLHTPPPIKGRHSVSLATPIMSPVPIFPLVRESTNLSQLSYYSEASLPGPLTRERTSLKQSLRTRTRGGTRYVLRFNNYTCKVVRADGGRITPRRSPCNTSIPDQLKLGYSARPTSYGLTDPWVDLSMDLNVLPKIDDRHLRAPSPKPPMPHKHVKRKRDPMYPQFPVVSMPSTEFDKRSLYYSQVPALRAETDKRRVLINKETKEDREYKQTKQDLYRMELDTIQLMDARKQVRMSEMYHAYLNNNPGSTKAVKECLKKMG